MNVNCSFNVHQLMVNWSKTAATCRHSINFPNCMVSNQNSYCLFSQLSNPKILWFHQNIIKMYFTETSGDWQAFQQTKNPLQYRQKKTKEITRNVNHKKSVSTQSHEQKRTSKPCYNVICMHNKPIVFHFNSINFLQMRLLMLFHEFSFFFSAFRYSTKCNSFFIDFVLTTHFIIFCHVTLLVFFFISNTTGNKRKI